jgi:beta-lactamase regulating signal transducer with metallopeptidase domain
METLSRFVITFLANAAWQTLMIGAVAAISARLLRNGPARYTHKLWFAALALSSLLPLAAALNLNPAARISSALNVQNAIDFMTASEVVGSLGPITAPVLDTKKGLTRFESNPFLAIFVLCFAGLFLHRARKLCISWYRATALVLGASALELAPSHKRQLEHCSATIGVKVPAVRFSNAVTTPVTAGVLQPTIVLPFDFFSTHSVELVVSALSHEMAHVRRRDYLWNLCAEICLLPICFHPLAFLLKRQLDHSRELACDEMVVTRAVPGALYARALVQLSSFATGVHGSDYALGVLDADILEERIMRIVNKNNRLNSRIAYLLVFAVSAVLGITSVFASALSVRFRAPVQNQSNYNLTSVDGTWQAKWHGDYPAVTLKLTHSGDSVSGSVVFYRLVKSGDGFRVDGNTGEIPLIDTIFDGTTLRFKTRGKAKTTGDEDVREFTVTFKDQNTAELNSSGVKNGLVLALTKEK